PLTTPSAPCPGLPLQWDFNTFWSTYPFHVHDPKSKYDPGYILIALFPPLIRSKHCIGSSTTPAAPCARCSTLNLDVEALRDRATESFDYARVEKRLNHTQLLEKIAALKQQLLNMERSLGSVREDNAEYTAIFRFLGTNRVPGLHRMFTNALEQKWASNKFHEKILAASRGEYIPRNYSQYEIDLAIVLYELGGGAAVYAMNHSIFALPSLNTLQSYRRQHRPKPCLDHINLLTISDNIADMFGPHEEKGGTSRAGPINICGHTLMFDELAIERRVDYMSTDEMAGFCLEHVGDALKTLAVGKDTSTVEAAVTAVKDGKVHIAHEATVGAIARLSRHDYGAKPVLIGPTCKKANWRKMLDTLQSTLEAWKHSPHGEVKHGPIFGVSSDGDYARRIALFMLCMQTEILPGNPLYPLICKLRGFNRRVGKDNLFMDSICTLLCSLLGMLVKGVCINRDLILLWLERLTNHDWSEMSIENLLHPTDAQNVSRAVKLLLAIVEIRSIDKEGLDPSEEAEFEALCLLGEMFDALVQPFIDPSLSLSQQLTSLVTFAHLACSLYLQNRTSFMSNQLYGDLQTMVKAAILMIARTQVLDPRLEVFFSLLGDNPVETIFGRTRMCGRHSPNCSIMELCTRLASAMNLDNVFNHHPELEREPRRLKLVRARDADHVGPRDWKGEVTADSCVIDTCYDSGVQRAEGILRKYSVLMEQSFSEHFQKPETDLLRPLGKHYLALSAENDRSLATPSDPADPSSINSANPVHQFDFDRRMGLDLAQRAATSKDPHSVFAAISDDGKSLCHKKAITWEREEIDAETVSASTHFQLGNLFATFVCYNGTHLALALAKNTLIKRGIPGSKSSSISAIPLAELALPSSPFTVCGQVFSLLPLKNDGSEWVWDGNFVSLSLKKKGKLGSDNVACLRNLQLTVSSRLIDPIPHDCRRDVSLSELETADNIIGSDTERQKTWVFSNDFVLAAWYRLRERIEKDVSLHDKIPVFSSVLDGNFPYQAGPSGDYPGIIYSYSIVNTAIFDVITNRQACRVCNKTVNGTDMQNHMGAHIRKALRNVHEDAVKCSVAKDHPCGMCGRSMAEGACQVRIKSGNLDSDCPSAYAFRISSASKSSEKRPCTNAPIQCPFCEQMHWKYNFPQHFNERHPSWRSLASPKFIQQISVTCAEELKLGIPDAKAVDWPPLTPHSPISGEKRPNPMSPRTPRRLHCKESSNGNKIPRLVLKISKATADGRTASVVEEDVFQ
ncbi:hypothetical protein C8R44DRAFT_654684, partial [Mycena epipterygia]